MTSGTTFPARNRRVLLDRRPAGVPEAGDFRIDESHVPRPDAGQILVRNLYLSVDAAQKGWAAAAANYSEPVPLGTVMRALAVGRIVESHHPDFRIGEYVYGWSGWQDYAVLNPDQVLTLVREPVMPLPAYAGVLGINGMTAWLALHGLGRPVAGETVLVTTAAGAVGSIVGQLAKAQGCRTIGLTGSDEKVARCLARFGYDVAANYRSSSPGQLIADLASGGIDVFFDNVGGGMLDHFLRAMRVNGRVIQCGTAAIASWSPTPHGLRNEREVLMRRLTWSGFVIFDHRARYESAQQALIEMIAAGSLVHDEDIQTGLECAPGAIARLYAGENEGKALIFIG